MKGIKTFFIYIALLVTVFTITCTEENKIQSSNAEIKKTGNKITTQPKPKPTPVTNPKPAPAPKPNPTPQEDKSSKEIQLIEPQNNEKKSGQNPQNKRLSLIAQMPTFRIMPEDFKIGNLQDLYEVEGDYAAITKKINSFFNDFAKKNINQDLFDDLSAKELTTSLSFCIEQDYIPTAYRIGKINIDDNGQARANIRLFKKAGITEGEIYLIKKNENWLILDIQAGFHLLNEVYQKDEDLFMPTSYRWMLYN